MLSLRDKVMAESLDTQDLVTLDELAILPAQHAIGTGP